MQTELQKIACDKTHSLAVYYVQPFDKLIGKHIEADACQVQAGKGNLYRHGSYTVKLDLILSHTGRPEAFITYNYDNYIPAQCSREGKRKVTKRPTFQYPYKVFYMTGG